MRIASLAAAAAAPGKNICLFEELSGAALRELASLAAGRAELLTAVFSGSDLEGYRYVIASNSVDLKANLEKLNSGILGKGGGCRSMIEGSARGSKEHILSFIQTFSPDEK